MVKENLLQLGITEDVADKVLEIHGQTLTGYVPATRYEELDAEKIRLGQSLLERDAQLVELKKGAGDNAELKAQLEAAIAKNKADSEAAAKEFAAYKKDNAVNLQLAQAGAKNPKAVKSLLDLEKVSLDGDNLIGFIEQLETLKTSDAYLFNTEPNLSGREPAKGTGGTGGTGGGEYKVNPWKKETENFTMQAEIYRNNPEQARKMAIAAGVKPPGQL